MDPVVLAVHQDQAKSTALQQKVSLLDNAECCQLHKFYV